MKTMTENRKIDLDKLIDIQDASRRVNPFLKSEVRLKKPDSEGIDSLSKYDLKFLSMYGLDVKSVGAKSYSIKDSRKVYRKYPVFFILDEKYNSYFFVISIEAEKSRFYNSLTIKKRYIYMIDSGLDIVTKHNINSFKGNFIKKCVDDHRQITFFDKEIGNVELYSEFDKTITVL